MARPALSMAALAFVAIALSMLIPVLGQLAVAPLAALLIGGGAGWWASKAMGYGTAGRGSGAGALAGIGALLGATIGLALLAGFTGSQFTSNTEFQQQFQEQLEQQREANPDAEIPEIDPNDFGAVAGIAGGIGGTILGFCLGMVYLLLSTLGGLIGGVMYGRNRGPTPAMAGGYSYEGSPPGGYQSQPYGSPPAGNTPGPFLQPSDSANLPRMTNRPDVESEGGARIYPDDGDEDRGARR